VTQVLVLWLVLESRVMLRPEEQKMGEAWEHGYLQTLASS